MANSSLYSCGAIEQLIDRYVNQYGGEVIELIPGCLGYGTTICMADGYKTVVIQEKYLNSWSSGNTVTKYNKCPKKYEKMLDDYYDHLDDYDEWIQEKLGIA